MSDRQRDYLEQIVREIEAVRRLARAHSLASFVGDEVAIAALERFVEPISESSRRIDRSLKVLESSIPWSDIAGIGNIRRHDYDSVDLAILWNIATRELPLLDAAVRRLLAGLDPPK